MQVTSGQDRHIAGTALPALAAGDNRHVNRVHANLLPTGKPVATSAVTVLIITNKLVYGKRVDQLLPRGDRPPTANRIG